MCIQSTATKPQIQEILNMCMQPTATKNTLQESEYVHSVKSYKT